MPFGRLATDTLRSGVLERDRTLPLRELFDRIDTSIGRWERRSTEAAANPAGGASIGLHPRLGEMTADQAGSSSCSTTSRITSPSSRRCSAVADAA